MPEHVRVREVGPRDGFQNEPEVIATADKVRLIDMLARTGLRRLEVTSFVRADVIPQLADGREVLEPGQILVDATVPLAAAVSGRATRLLGVPQGSAAQQAQEMVPDGVIVVSALHTVSGAKLGDLDHELDEDVPVMGDKREPKKRVADLIALIDGLRPINAGLLEAARLVESLTPLLISVNARHKTHAGMKLTGIPEERW